MYVLTQKNIFGAHDLIYIYIYIYAIMETMPMSAIVFMIPYILRPSCF